MVDVPDHLVPADGLTNSLIRLAGLETHDNDPGMTMRFEVYDEDESFVGTISIPVSPTAKGTIDAMVVKAYDQLILMLRQWLYEADKMREGYEKKGAG